MDMLRNPLNPGGKPHERLKAKDVLNQKKERILRFSYTDGSIREIVLEARESLPDGKGSYIHRETKASPRDHAGNTLGPEPERTIMSHTGLFIESPMQRALCTSIFHTSGSRNILIGQDGRLTQRGAICSRCDYWLNTTYIGAGVIIFGIVIGIFRGTGFF